MMGEVFEGLMVPKAGADARWLSALIPRQFARTLQKAVVQR